MALAGLGQTQVNVVPAPGIEGDFANANPRFAAVSGPGGFVAGVGGVIAGRFCWGVPGALDVDSGPQVVVNSGSGAPIGLVWRGMQGLIPNPLVQPNASMVIPQGFMVTPMNGGDFWVKNSGTTQAVFGQKAYAKYADGSISFAATGAPSTATASSWSISAQTFSVTGSITGNVLTVTAVGSGTIYPGAAISGTSVTTGNTIGAQLSGTAGGVGTYSTTIAEQTVVSETISGTYGLLTLTTVATGTFGVGDTLTGTSVAAGTVLTQFITGAGGSGSTAAVNNTATASAGTLTGALNYETKFIAMSGGLAGELVKISDHANG